MAPEPYRWGILAASAWRVLAELHRRHARQRPLRIMHYYPGASPWGEIRLQEGWGVGDRPSITLGLGGGGFGKVEVQPWRPVESPAIARWRSPNVVRRLLTERDPKSVIDDIEQSAGLDPVASIPPETPNVLAVWTIAELLERHALKRTTLRASCGFLDAGSYPGITEWAKTAPTIRARLSRATYPASTDAELANRIWALHPSLPEDGPASGALPVGSVIFDIGSGEVWRAKTPEQRTALMSVFTRAGHRIDGVVAEVERLMRAG